MGCSIESMDEIMIQNVVSTDSLPEIKQKEEPAKDGQQELGCDRFYY